MKHRIPFNKPFFFGKELSYMAQSVHEGHCSGDGPFTQKCQNLLENNFGAKKILLTHSCTAALEMAAILCGISHGDEVILPSFTFVSTANAFFLRGAKPVFIDIRKDTLNMDETKIAEAITPKTKVILPVHYAGVGCEMGEILRIAKKHQLYVVEDAAQGVNSQYQGKYLGTFGDIGAYSFHETKNVMCGEGGAIVLNNDRFIERAEIIREKGTNRNKFFRGEIDKYTWTDIGSSYLLSDLLAAFLFAQLENMEQINKRRRRIFQNYFDALLPLSRDGILELPYVADNHMGSYHLFYILVESERIRDKLIGHMKSKSISTVFHYLPLHTSPVGRSFGYSDGSLPITESISKRLLRLPFYFELSQNQQEEVVREIKIFFSG